MAELVLSENEKQMLAEMPQHLTAGQKKQIIAMRTFQSWYDQKEGVNLSKADLDLLTSTLLQHGLDATQEGAWEQVYNMLNAADLLELPPDAPAKPAPFTAADIDAMDSTTYRRHLTQTPGFAALVDSLEFATKPDTGNHARQQFKR